MRVEVLEEMEVMIVALLAKFWWVLDGEGRIEGKTYGLLGICRSYGDASVCVVSFSIDRFVFASFAIFAVWYQ